jgi:hypothetical protein
MPPRIVIVAYKPKPGKENELKKLAKEHHEVLWEQGLVTERKPILMQSGNKTIIEVFEWKSEEIIKQAHTNPAVLKLWEQYSLVCDYIPISQVAETANLFSEFSPV